MFLSCSSLALTGLIVSFVPVAAQETATSVSITAGDLQTRLAIVADDSMMGREAGRRGNFMATDYIASGGRRGAAAGSGGQRRAAQAVSLPAFLVKGLLTDH